LSGLAFGAVDRPGKADYVEKEVYLYRNKTIMAFHVRDEATDKAVRRLAKLKGKSLTDTIREAVEYERTRAAIPLIERLKPIQEEFRRLSKPGGLPADKAFFDELSGDF
jgi:antitoxin VapB